jgi:hypothetical protein
MSTTRITPDWAKPQESVYSSHPQPAPGAHDRGTRQQQRAAANARLATPEALAKQAEQTAERDARNAREAERIDGLKPVLEVAIYFEDGTPATVDGRKIVGKVKAEDVSWAVATAATWNDRNARIVRAR